MKTCFGIMLSMSLASMLAVVEMDTLEAKEFSITGEFMSESVSDINATVLVSKEVLTESGSIEAVELAKGMFSDGEVLLSGTIDSPTFATITVSFDDYDALSIAAVIAPDDDLLFRVLQADDGTPNQLMFEGRIRLHDDESKKVTVMGDLSSLEEFVPGTTVGIGGFDGEGSKNYGSVLVAKDGTFKIENMLDEPRVIRIQVRNAQGFNYVSKAILEPQTSISLIPDTQGNGITTHSDSEFHAALVDSWEKSEKYLALDEARRSASEEYQRKMASGGETVDPPDLDDALKEAIPILALAHGIPPVKECEHVDLTQVKIGQEDYFEATLPRHIKVQKEMTRFRDRALEDIAEFSEDPMESLLAVELGAFGIFSEEFYRGLDVMDELTTRLADDLVKRRLLPWRARLAPLIEDEINSRNLVPGQKAPTFTLPDLEGVEVSLQQVLETNDVVLVEWWASWCGPCIAKFPELKKLYASYQDAGIQVITINVDETYDEWKQESDKHKLPWIDLGEGEEAGPVSTSYGIQRYPMGYVVDNEGCIVQKDLGTDMLAKFLDETFGDIPKAAE